MLTRHNLVATIAIALACPAVATAQDKSSVATPVKVLPPIKLPPGPPPPPPPRDDQVDADDQADADDKQSADQADADQADADDKQSAASPGDNADQPTTDDTPNAPGANEVSDDELDALFSDSEVVIVEGRAPVGSGHSIDEKQLEKFEHDDVHKVLAAVPGVYVREEDGYGLRPNIGMRGSGSERSSKIALMEDGVLIAPAPYAAPAAYYFPLMTRMVRLDVLKGPAAIQHGPNTVGGSLDLISRPIPDDLEGRVDIAAGENLYGKLHTSVGQSWDNVGFLVEAARLQTDGFKQLDGGGDTGFDKNDVLVKARAHTSRSGRMYNEINLKLGYSDEVSNETYTGITAADFAENPYRRYLGTSLDQMKANHWQFQLDHRFEYSGDIEVHTTLYRNQFSRDWRKLDGFVDDNIDLRAALRDPTSSDGQLALAILTGAQDTDPTRLNDDELLIGTNARDFTTMGIQTRVRMQGTTGDVLHSLEAGVRLHSDDVKRFSFGETFAVLGGELVQTAAERQINRDWDQGALAWAFHASDRAEWGPLTATAGLRVEYVTTNQVERPTRNDEPQMSVFKSDSYSVVIPGGGAMLRVAEGLNIIGGVHRGFSPVAPGQNEEIKPESSINYEFGARFDRLGIRAEAMGFFSDYSNLSTPCAVRNGCTSEQVGDQFNGGAVQVGGLEALAGTEFVLGSWSVPVQATYTLNVSEFQTSFESDNPAWGRMVEAGDELPYLPRHQVFGQVGVARDAWSIDSALRYTSRMRDQASQGDEGPFTDDSLIFDLAGHYDFGRAGTVYATVNNVFDQANIVSLRPFGARPGVPRLVMVGYRNQF